eukprot:TRINITY_DN93680_c0_g1_i1.p1 TRINITY_DN93680_c0_g1~~TRINITY_DN93680_c0_g1_i1.p1  ORF type:complete len:367 (-),score=58.80 TRINITY_DN93680_c0_g1_i1:94-1194(-)
MALGEMKEPLLPRCASDCRVKLDRDGACRRRWRPAIIILCFVHVVFGMSGPVMLDWVKRHHGGVYRFSIPALTFHAYTFAVMLGFTWTLLHGREGLRQLNRPDMLCRFFVTSSLFTVGDILSFMSMQHLDPGTFSLMGKGLSIGLTVLLTRMLLGRKQTRLQYILVSAVAVSTFVFCHQESLSRSASLASEGSASAAGGLSGDAELTLGIVQRCSAVLLLSLAAVLQEQLLTREPDIPFALQQCWMGCGALSTSLAANWLLHRELPSQLLRGFDDWRVMMLLAFYVANGLTAGLMVKRLGALAKALCVPIYLGGCYAYAVLFGSATIAAGAVGAWALSTTLIVAFVLTKLSPGVSFTRMSVKPPVA